MSEDIKKLKAKEYQARYYAKNKDKCLQMVKEWKVKNPEKAKQINKVVYQNSRKKNQDGVSSYELNLKRLNEKYKSDPDYREKYLAKQREYRSTEDYKLKKKKYNQTAKHKENQKKHNDLRKIARAVLAKERAELKALLSPEVVKEPKPVKAPKVSKEVKPRKPKTPKKPQLKITVQKLKPMTFKSVIVTAPTKALTTKEIWLKKHNQIQDKLRSKDKNHIDLKSVSKDPYAHMTLTKSIQVKI